MEKRKLNSTSDVIFVEDDATDKSPGSPDTTNSTMKDTNRSTANDTGNILSAETNVAVEKGGLDSVTATEGLNKVYGEFDESDIAEIYLGRDETEDAVAGLEMSTAQEKDYAQLEEQTSFPETRFTSGNNCVEFVPNSVEELEYQASPVPSNNVECDSTNNSVSDKLSSNEQEHDKLQSEISLKRSCDSPEINIQNKRQKIDSEQGTQKMKDNHFDRQPNESLVSRSNSAIETNTPVAIVTPMGLREDFQPDTNVTKGERDNEKEIEELKSDISAILDSFEDDDVKSKEVDQRPSLKLTDFEFEKFKNDLFSEQSFKNLDGNNFSLPNNNNTKLVRRASSVESDIGDFEKVLSKFIKNSSENNVSTSTFSSVNRIPVQKPFKGYRKDFDPTDPSVVLSNSELLRELLEDKPDKNKTNSKRPASVDLSFLKTDMLASKRNSVPVSSVLKTKPIDPTTISPQAFCGGNVTKDKMLYDNFKPKCNEIPDKVQISVPSENVSGSDSKAVDHGPLSLAEQRRASVTLHHKVPSITDLISASGPLNKMDGDETEAILNEIIGSPSTNNYDTYKRDFASPNGQHGMSVKMGLEGVDLQHSVPTSRGVNQSMLPEYNGRVAGNSIHIQNQMHALNDHHRHMKMDNPPQMMRPPSLPSSWSVDFENMPPERRQILAARYGHLHLMRGAKSAMVDPTQDRMNSAQPFQQLHDPSSSNILNSSLLSSRIDSTKAFMTRDQQQKPGEYNFRDAPNSNFAIGNNPSDPKNTMNSSVSEGPGGMNDKMRMLMMQQLQRRRMMAQMKSQQETGGARLPVSMNINNGINQPQQQPYGMPTQPVRHQGPFSSSGYQQFPYNSRSRVDGMTPPFNSQSHSGHARQQGNAMYPGLPVNPYQRQMSHPGSMGPLGSPTHPSMTQNQAASFNFEVDKRQDTKPFSEMNQSMRHMSNYNMPSFSQNQMNNQTQFKSQSQLNAQNMSSSQNHLNNQNNFNSQVYMQSNGAFNNQITNHSQTLNHSQNHIGLATGNDVMNSGVQSAHSPFGQSGSDFF